MNSIKYHLSDKRLKEILKEIDQNPQMRQLYSSKWHKVKNFLYSNTNLKISKIAKGGSIAKHTAYRDSDLDIIFCSSLDYNWNIVMHFIRNKASIAFGQIAKVWIGKKAIHIDFKNPKCHIDVVYLSNREFVENYQEIKRTSKISNIQQNSIKLTKYAFDRVQGVKIHGYEIEKNSFQFNSSSLSEYVYSIVRYFKGKLEQNNLTINDVLKHLI
ncbi:MAG: hypothetical protein ACFFDN_30545 [Candidatus Hodarchaeota archaeon]